MILSPDLKEYSRSLHDTWSFMQDLRKLRSHDWTLLKLQPYNTAVVRLHILKRESNSTGGVKN
jgi:hypothetical protein